jgi:salicylate hydroxylase
MKIVVVGAGVAGAIMARRLARLDGLDVHCLERVGRDDHSESGTGLNVGPNAVKLLRRLDADLASELEKASLPWTRWRTELTDGTLLSDLALSDVADCPGIRIRWSELYRVLRRGAPIIQYNCALEDIEPVSGSEKLRVRWRQNGGLRQLQDIDLVIAADGRYSRVRAQFSGTPPVRHLGVVIMRTLVPDTSGGLLDDFVQWFNGPNRLLAFRVPPGNIYITATRATEPGATILPAWQTAESIRACFEPIGGWVSPEVRWLLDALCANLQESHWARMQEAPPLFAEPQANIMYLGDSAHGMVPTLGQGATQAIEDACVACGIIEDLVARGNVLPRAVVEAVDQSRSARMRFVMDLSRRASDTLLLGADPVAAAKWKTEEPYINDLRRLYLQGE